MPKSTKDTTIRISYKTKEKLDKYKLVPMESYDHLVNRMVDYSSTITFSFGGTVLK